MADFTQEFPFTPEEVTTWVGSKQPEALTVDEKLTLFWNAGEPAEQMSKNVDKAIDALREGSDIVIMSGRNGTGKTMQFSAKLQRELNPAPRYFPYARIGAIDAAIKRGHRQIILDEASGAMHGRSDRDLPKEIGRTVGKLQIVAMFPGANKTWRRSGVGLFVEETLAEAPKAVITDLGDIGTETMPVEKAEYALRAAGMGQEVIDLVSREPALRNLPLFDGLFLSGMEREIGRGGVADAQLALDALANTITGGKAASEPAQRIGDDLRWGFMRSGNRATKHLPFISSSFTTDEAIQLYKLVDMPLPGPGDFGDITLDFDPYDKY